MMTFRRTCLTLLILTPALLSWHGVAFSQDVEKAAVKAESQNKLVVFRLKYADAVMALQVAQTTMAGEPEMRLSVDERTNAIIAWVNDQQHKKLSSVLAELDGARNENVVKIIPLDDNNLTVTNVIDDMFGATVQVAHDHANNKLLLRGTKEDVETVEQILRELTANREPGHTQHQIRVLWLVSGNEDLPPPGDDLAEVRQELERVGMSKIGIAAQYLIRATEGTAFDISGEVVMRNTYQVSIQGQLQANQLSPDAPLVEIQLDIQATEIELFNRLNTAIAAPSGHYVVLGVGPLREMQSAFVIQRLQ